MLAAASWERMNLSSIHEPQSATQRQAPCSYCSRQAIDLHFRLTVNGRIKWDDHPDRRSSMEAHLLAIDIDDQVGIAIRHSRRFIEPWCNIDHGEDPQPGSHAIKIAQRPFEARKVCERHPLRQFVALLRRNLGAYLAKRLSDRAIDIGGDVAGDIGAIPS